MTDPVPNTGLTRAHLSFRARPNQPMGPRTPQRGMTISATTPDTTSVSAPASTHGHGTGSSQLTPPLPDASSFFPQTFSLFDPPASPIAASASAHADIYSSGQPAPLYLPSSTPPPPHESHSSSNAPLPPLTDHKPPLHSAESSSFTAAPSTPSHFADRPLPPPPIPLPPLPPLPSHHSSQASKPTSPPPQKHLPAPVPVPVSAPAASTSASTSAPVPIPVPTPKAPTPKPAGRSAAPKTIPFIPPKPVNLDVPAIPWKSIPLEAALWTFSSRELQALVSRSIRSSAKESFIRLLSLETIDQVLPPELERLENARAMTQSKYRFLVHRRNMLLQALNNASAGSTTGGGSGVGGGGGAGGSGGSGLGAGSSSGAAMMGLANGNASGSGSAGGGEGEDNISVVSKLTHQLSQTIVECEEHLAELVRINDQIGQINRLVDVHWASALSIALRKLNGSYGKRTQDLISARQRIEELEAELEDAWRTAEEMARELDEQDAQINASFAYDPRHHHHPSFGSHGEPSSPSTWSNRAQMMHNRPGGSSSRGYGYEDSRRQYQQQQQQYQQHQRDGRPSGSGASSSRHAQGYPQSHASQSNGHGQASSSRGYPHPHHQRTNSNSSNRAIRQGVIGRNERSHSHSSGTGNPSANATTSSGANPGMSSSTRRAYAHDVPSSVTPDPSDSLSVRSRTGAGSPSALGATQRSASPASPVFVPSRFRGYNNRPAPNGRMESPQQYPYTPSPPPSRPLEYSAGQQSPRAVPHMALSSEHLSASPSPSVAPAPLHPPPRLQNQVQQSSLTPPVSHSVSGSELEDVDVDVDEEEAVISRAEVVSIPSTHSQSQTSIASPVLNRSRSLVQMVVTPPRSPRLPPPPGTAETIVAVPAPGHRRFDSQDLVAVSGMLVGEVQRQQQQQIYEGEAQAQVSQSQLQAQPQPYPQPQAQVQAQPETQSYLHPHAQPDPSQSRYSQPPPDPPPSDPLQGLEDPDSEFDVSMIPPPPYAKDAADDPHHLPGGIIVGEDGVPISINLNGLGVGGEIGMGVGIGPGEASGSGSGSSSIHAPVPGEGEQAAVLPEAGEGSAVERPPPPRTASLLYSQQPAEQSQQHLQVPQQEEEAPLASPHSPQAPAPVDVVPDNDDVQPILQLQVEVQAEEEPAVATAPEVPTLVTPVDDEANGDVSANNNDDDDNASVHSTHSTKSTKSTKSHKSLRSASRLSIVSAARMRSHRASKGSLRLPKGFKLFSTSPHHRSASVGNSRIGLPGSEWFGDDELGRPPVPDLPSAYLNVNSSSSRKGSPSRKRANRISPSASRSFLDLDSPLVTDSFDVGRVDKGKEKQKKLTIDDIEIAARDIPDGLENGRRTPAGGLRNGGAASGRGRLGADDLRIRTQSQQFGAMDDILVSARRVARPVPGRSTVDDIGVITKSRMIDEEDDEEDAPQHQRDRKKSSDSRPFTAQLARSLTVPSIYLNADTRNPLVPASPSAIPPLAHAPEQGQGQEQNTAIADAPVRQIQNEPTAAPETLQEQEQVMPSNVVPGSVEPNPEQPPTTEPSAEPASELITSPDDTHSTHLPGLPSGAAAPSRTSSFISSIHPLVNLNLSNPDLTLFLPSNNGKTAGVSRSTSSSSGIPLNIPQASASTPGLVNSDETESSPRSSMSTIASLTLSRNGSVAARSYHNAAGPGMPAGAGSKLPSIQKLKTLTKRYSLTFPLFKQEGVSTAPSSSGASPSSTGKGRVASEGANGGAGSAAAGSNQGSGPSRLGLGGKMQSKLQSVKRWNA